MNKCSKAKSLVVLALLVCAGVMTIYKRAVDKEVNKRLNMFKPWEGMRGMAPFKGVPPLAGMRGMGMGAWHNPFAPHYGTLDMGAFRDNK